MRLSLSSAAAPDATLTDLLASASRRGLAALELVEGHAHGISTGIDAAHVEATAAAISGTEIKICGIYRDQLNRSDLQSAAQLAALLNAPFVVPAHEVNREILPEAAVTFQAAGAELILSHGSEPAVVEILGRFLDSLPHPETIRLGWEVRPQRDDPALVGGVVRVAGPKLRYVRLHGGGPEAAEQTGRGVGALMARLTLARYTGPLVLTPSTPRYHYVWRSWLGQAGGWGCGSKQSDPSLVALE